MGPAEPPPMTRCLPGLENLQARTTAKLVADALRDGSLFSSGDGVIGALGDQEVAASGMEGEA